MSPADAAPICQYSERAPAPGSGPALRDRPLATAGCIEAVLVCRISLHEPRRSRYSAHQMGDSDDASGGPAAGRGVREKERRSIDRSSPRRSGTLGLPLFAAAAPCRTRVIAFLPCGRPIARSTCSSSSRVLAPATTVRGERSNRRARARGEIKMTEARAAAIAANAAARSRLLDVRPAPASYQSPRTGIPRSEDVKSQDAPLRRYRAVSAGRDFVERYTSTG